MLAAALQQPTVGGVCNRFGHDGGVNDDAVHAGDLHDAAAPRGLNSDHGQGLHAFFANALSPARQAAGVDRCFGLQVDLAAEVLPVRVLHPGVDDSFVRCIKGVLQIQQPGDQSRRQRRATAAGGEAGAEGALNLSPVDQAGQARQRMAQVDLFIESSTTQRSGLRQCRSGAHRNLVEICKKTILLNASACKPRAPEATKRSIKSNACGMFRTDYLRF